MPSPYTEKAGAGTGTGAGAGTGAEPNKEYLICPPSGDTPPSPPQAFREGGEDGVVEGLAPRERRLPPPEGLGGGVRRRSGGARVICDHVHLGSKPAELDVKSSREVGNYNMYTEAQLQLIPVEKHRKFGLGLRCDLILS